MRVRSGRGAGEGGGSSRAALCGQPRPAPPAGQRGRRGGTPPLSRREAQGESRTSLDLQRGNGKDPAAAAVGRRGRGAARRYRRVGPAVPGQRRRTCGKPGAPPAHRFRHGKPVTRRRTGTPKYSSVPARRRPAGRCRRSVPRFPAAFPFSSALARSAWRAQSNHAGGSLRFG